MGEEPNAMPVEQFVYRLSEPVLTPTIPSFPSSGGRDEGEGYFRINVIGHYTPERVFMMVKKN